MKVIRQRVFDGKNIYSHKKVIKVDLDLEGYKDIPSKDILGFNEKLLSLLPELKEHRCGIDENQGFYIRLIEGTYLAHICEHMIIGLQNRMGIDAAYGKAREIKDNIYYIIFEYEYKNTALAIVSLAVDIINTLIMNTNIDLDARLKIINEIFKREIMGPSTKSIYDNAKEMGLPIIDLGEGFYQIGYGKRGRVFSATIGSETKSIAVDICCDKYMTKKILEMNSVPVANGCKVKNTIDLLKCAEEIGYPVVLKPQFGSKGAGVFVNIKNEIDLLKAFANIREKTDDVIIEEYIEGKDYRVCVVDYKVVAVAKRTPPYVIGDGKNSLKELIKEININPLRGDGHEKPLTKIKLDKDLDTYLKKNKMTINYIPDKDEKVFLRENANLSTGGFAEDCTEVISKENIKICERAAKALGLDICGIDISTNNIARSLNDYGIIIEVNAAPGIRMHELPIKGVRQNVSKQILKTMYPDGFSNIPVVSITGTNGKTTTTRLIAHVVSMLGYTVGLTSTDGVMIGNEFIHRGDDTGLESAKSVLINKDVDIAVLETARGGIVRKGLAYELSDVGIVTNIGDDHLGIDGINSLDDLAFVKALVLESVKKDGYAVINADDEYCDFLIRRSKKYGVKTILFSFDKKNKFIEDNIIKGNPSVYIDDDFIKVYNNNKEYSICNYKEIPLTMNGHLKYNVYNTLAACGGLIGMNIDYVLIAKGFLQFKSDETFNSGRFNIHDVLGREIIMDYGHNIGGYKAVIESLKTMEKENIIAIIGVPGDRNDNVIETIGKLSSDSFSKIYIKEDLDKRGRADGEIAQILLNAVKKGKCLNYRVELDEVSALEKAFFESKIGDTIIIFYEEYNRVLGKINELQNIKDERLRLEG